MADDKTLALRLQLLGNCSLHSKLHARSIQWTEEFRGIAASMGNVWLEKVKFRTNRKTSLEEIVGEISDEFDEEDEVYQKIAENIYDFEGRTSINDMCKVLKVDTTIFDEIRGESESIGGMLLEEFSDLPNTGEFFDFEKFNFTILAVDKRRIKKVRVKVG